MTFAEWIDKKTPETLHIVLGQRIGTIRMWKHRNIIPRDVWPEIMKGFAEVGLNDLLDMERAAGQVSK